MRDILIAYISDDWEKKVIIILSLVLPPSALNLKI